MKTDPLPWIEWNFDAVPNSELVACCFWEYARESASIRELHRRSLTPDFEAQSESLRDPVYFGLCAMHFGGRRWPSCAVFRDSLFGKRIFPRPWQSLPAARRTRLAGQKLLGKRPAFMRSDAASAFQLAHRFDPQRQTLVPEPKASLGADGGLELTVVEINWAESGNEAIVASFRSWLKANRPVTVRQPSRRGRDKDISYRVDLERLGILRLLHQNTPADLRAKHPAAWQRYSTPNRRWQLDANKARARFQQLFPFLPATENPRSWPPE